MKKQTAVEWLIEFIETNIISLEMEIDTPEKYDHWDIAKIEAMAKEKEQIEMAHAHGYLECDNFYADKNYKPLNRYDYYERNYE